MRRTNTLETPVPACIDQTFEVVAGRGRVVGSGSARRELEFADTGFRLARVVRQLDAQGELLNNAQDTKQIFDGTEVVDIRSFFSMDRDHKEVNRRMERATQKLVKKYSGHEPDHRPIIRSDFRSKSSVESRMSFGVVHVNEVPLYFNAARRMRDLETTPDWNPSWRLYVDTGCEKLPADMIHVFGTENNDPFAHWDRLEKVVERGRGAFMEPYNEGLPLTMAWHTGILAMNAYLEHAYETSLSQS